MATTGAGSPYVLGTDNITTYPATSLALANRVDAVESGAAAALTSGLAAKTDLAMVQNAQTGTSYSYALTDASKLLSMSNAASNTVLVTKQATVTWVTGTQLRIINLGAGVTTLVADTGVTINGNVSLKQYQGGTLIRTASDVWLFVPTASGSGMDLITPTSVVGATLSGGQVSFSASSEVDVNGCFTSAYSHYKIVLDWTPSTTADITMRMRVAGANNTTSNYTYQTISADSTSVSSGRSASASSWLGAFNAAGTNAQMAEIIIYSPFDTAKTGGSFVQVRDTTAALRYYAVNLAFDATTSFDGFALIPTTGNITGKLRVYGLRNS